MAKSRKRRRNQRRQQKAQTHGRLSRTPRLLRCERLEDRRLLAVVTVDTHLDTVDINDDVTSLREAISTTNLVGGADEIDFDATLAGETILLTMGELAITDSLTINGLGAEWLTIDASGNDPTPNVNNGDGSRVFSIVATGSISGLTLTGGDVDISGGAIWTTHQLSISDVHFVDNYAVRWGGGISLSSGGFVNSSLLITDSVFTGNSSAGLGGGVRIFGTAIIQDSRFEANEAHGGEGGGVYLRSYGGATADDIQFTRVQFVNNFASGNGGGLYTHNSYSPSQVTSSEFTDNVSSEAGGGFYAKAATTITESTFVNNVAGSWGGGTSLSLAGTSRVVASQFIANHAVQGGAIAGSITPGELYVESTLIEGNTATQSGGGITTYDQTFVIDSTIINNTAEGEIRPGGGSRSGGGGGIFSQANISVLRSEISGNTSYRNGGGIHTFVGYSTIQESTVSGNTASELGGGIYAEGRVSVAGDDAEGGRVVVMNSTVANNQAGTHGGAIAARGGRSINGIGVLGGDVTLLSSTISGNQAGEQGGGIFVAKGIAYYGGTTQPATLEVSHSTITNNTADSDLNGSGFGSGIRMEDGVAFLDHTIVAGNHDISNTAPDVAANFNSNFSLVSIGAEYLGPLADNDGPTLTHALLPGSPAIDAGDPSLLSGVGDTPEFDQRGAPFARVAGGRIDIGAYEVQPVTGDLDQDGDTDGFDFLAWQRGFGMPSGATLIDGDATGDGDVDSNDGAVWEATFGDQLSVFSGQLSGNVSINSPRRAELIDAAMAAAVFAERDLIGLRSRQIVEQESEPVATSRVERRFDSPNTVVDHRRSDGGVNLSQRRDAERLAAREAKRLATDVFDELFSQF